MFKESTCLASGVRLFQSLTVDGRKELEYRDVRAFIVRRSLEFRKLYLDVCPTLSGTREER